MLVHQNISTNNLISNSQSYTGNQTSIPVRSSNKRGCCQTKRRNLGIMNLSGLNYPEQLNSTCCGGDDGNCDSCSNNDTQRMPLKNSRNRFEKIIEGHNYIENNKSQINLNKK